MVLPFYRGHGLESQTFNQLATGAAHPCPSHDAPYVALRESCGDSCSYKSRRDAAAPVPAINENAHLGFSPVRDYCGVSNRSFVHDRDATNASRLRALQYASPKLFGRPREIKDRRPQMLRAQRLDLGVRRMIRHELGCPSLTRVSANARDSYPNFYPKSIGYRMTKTGDMPWGKTDSR